MQKWCKVKHLFNTLDFKIDASLAGCGTSFETIMANNATFCQICLYMAMPYPHYTVKDVVQCLTDYATEIVDPNYRHPYDLEMAACLLLLEQFDDNKEEIQTWCAYVAHYLVNTGISALVAGNVYERVTTPKITLATRRLQINNDGD